jgi:hypothetical protein
VFAIGPKVGPEFANTAVEDRPVTFRVRVKPGAVYTVRGGKAAGVGAGAGSVALEETAEFAALVATLDGAVGRE